MRRSRIGRALFLTFGWKDKALSVTSSRGRGEGLKGVSEELFGVAAGTGGIDVLPEVGADIEEPETLATLKEADGIRGGAVAAQCPMIAESLNEGRGAPEEAGVDGVEVGQLFGDLEIIGIGAHLGGVRHIEDGLELFIDHQDGVAVRGKSRGEVFLEMIEEGGIEEVIAHGEPERGAGAFGLEDFGGSEDGEAVGGAVLGVMDGPEAEVGRSGKGEEGLFESLVVVAGDDEDLLDLQALEVLEVIGEQRPVGQAGEEFVAFRGLKAAAKAGGEDDGSVGMHRRSPGEGGIKRGRVFVFQKWKSYYLCGDRRLTERNQRRSKTGET